MQQLSLDDAVSLIAAAADSKQYACMWQLNALTPPAGISLPPSAACAMVIAAAHTQHFDHGALLWRALAPDVAQQAAADDVLLLQAAVTCLQRSGACPAALHLYNAVVVPPTSFCSVGCSSAVMSACAQAGLWQQAADMLQHVPQQHRAECDVQAVAQAALQGGGHAAVCDLFFKHLQQQWREVQGEALCLFLTSLHAQGHSREEEQLLQHLQSIGAAFPQAAACCMPILLQRAQFERVVDSYFLLKRAALPISPPTFSCVIAACARHPLPFATFAAMLEAARLSLSPLPLPPHDWDNAAAAAAHSASPLEARSFACEAHAAGHKLDAAAATALLLATSARGSGAEVVQLLQLLPLPLPSQCVAAAATALVQQDLWQDALAVVEVEGGCSALSLAAPQPYDLACVERCSKLFKVHGIPTDACFTKAALRCRCMQLLQAGSSDAAAQLLLPALRNSLADVHTCVHVIIALASDAAAPPPHASTAPSPGPAAAASCSGSSAHTQQQSGRRRCGCAPSPCSIWHATCLRAGSLGRRWTV